MFTKTVVDPETHNEVVLVQCDSCNGTGRYWRPDIFSWWPCNKCEGHGCLEIGKAQQFSPHEQRNDRPYRPVKGRA